MDLQRLDQGGDAKDEADVGDVGTDDVAEGDVAAAVEGGDHVDGKLRRAGAEGDHRQADDQGGNAHRLGQGRRAAHQQLAAAEQKGHAPGQHKDIKQHYRFPRGVSPSAHNSKV